MKYRLAYKAKNVHFYVSCCCVAVVDPGTPPAGHISGAWLYSAGRPAAHEEEPGTEI